MTTKRLSEKAIAAIEGIITKGNRAEIVPIKDGIKIITTKVVYSEHTNVTNDSNDANGTFRV